MMTFLLTLSNRLTLVESTESTTSIAVDDEFPPDISELSYDELYGSMYNDFQGDNYCLNGIIHESNAPYCCPKECHQCGGPGCGANGMARKCCTGNYVNKCEDFDAPCIINKSDQSVTGLCVLTPYFTKHLGGNYHFIGHYNSKPYWEKEYEYFDDDDESEGSNNGIVQGTMYLFYENDYWRIYSELGGNSDDTPDSSSSEGYARSKYQNENTPYNDSSWLLDIVVVEGNCEEYYQY